MTSLKTWAGYVGAGLILLFAAGLVGWTWGRSALKKDIAAAPRDTLTQFVLKPYPVPEIKYIHLPARIDTLRDTTFVDRKDVVASLDTIMAIHQDTLGIEYHFPPLNFFNVDFRPGPIPVLEKTETVTKTVIETEISFPWLMGAAAAGIATGIIIARK